jgi:hypothetical protein
MPDSAPTAPVDAAGQASPAGAPDPAAGPAGGDVDVQKLADKVYRLMLADVRRDALADRRPFLIRRREG